MSAQELLSVIDENKENLPNGLYMKLCDVLMSKKRKENEIKENKEGFYRINYIYPTLENEDGTIFIKMQKETEIVKLKVSFVKNFIDKHIGIDGIFIDNIRDECCSENISQKLTRYGSVLNVSHLIKIEPSECEECEEYTEGNKILENIPYMTSVIITKIKQVHLSQDDTVPIVNIQI